MNGGVQDDPRKIARERDSQLAPLVRAPVLMKNTFSEFFHRPFLGKHYVVAPILKLVPADGESGHICTIKGIIILSDPTLRT